MSNLGKLVADFFSTQPKHHPSAVRTGGSDGSSDGVQGAAGRQEGHGEAGVDGDWCPGGILCCFRGFWIEPAVVVFKRSQKVTSEGG